MYHYSILQYYYILSLGISLFLQDGARCLDGSPPAYYIREGKDNGKDKWILHLMGGAWCFFKKDYWGLADLVGRDWIGCYERSNLSWTDVEPDSPTIGTTNNLPSTFNTGGILSDDQIVNPNFYNWNHVFIVYCDGFSFAGDK